MSTQNDLLNGSNNKSERLASEVPVNTQMCSNWQDDSDEMFPYWLDDTCGDSGTTTSERYVKILDLGTLRDISCFLRETEKSTPILGLERKKQFRMV